MTKRFRVKSASAEANGISEDDPRAWHIVSLTMVSGKPVFTCDCPGNAQWGKECSHIRFVKASLVSDNPIQEFKEPVQEESSALNFDVDSLLRMFGG